jgi:hypothetical protein
MPPRTCLVTVTDVRGIRHTVEVQAETLYEAAALALQALRAARWVEDLGPATRLEVEVPEPSVKHSVTVQQLRRWAEASAITPADRIRKDQVKAMLT